MRDINDSVMDLLARMTLVEKVAQTLSIAKIDITLQDLEKADESESTKLRSFINKIKYGVGSLQFPGTNYLPGQSTRYNNALQHLLIKSNRLGIPALIQEECLNGHVANGSTMFPKPIGLASTWDSELVENIYSAIGQEVRARGGHQAFTPVLDIGRDPRWGRIEETYGEDTYLVTIMGVAAVRGLQGGNKGVSDSHVISSPKHFVGYAQCAGGRNFAPTDITERILRDQILPPFKSAVVEAGALGIMPSHAENDGVPCHGNKKLLTELLRGEWGFKGIVVSDYDDVPRLDVLHHVAANPLEAAVLGLKAGVDMDLPLGSSFRYLTEACTNDPSLLQYLDQAVIRILKLKFELGLFDNPYANADEAEKVVNCYKHRNLAKTAASKAIILLKNENNLLPLDRKKIKKIAVIGPNADPVEFSYYSVRPNVGISILDGIRKKAGSDFEVLYEKGCSITKQGNAMETELNICSVKSELYKPGEEKESIEKAVILAKIADIAVLCVGGSPTSSREAIFAPGYYGDNDNLDLLGEQNALARAVLQTGTPVVAVLINGKPLSCNYVYEKTNAVLEGWYLGQETGNAIADVLFGDVNPGGKLPVTIARSAAQLPVYYSQKPTGMLKGYLFADNSPLFPFGFGLSYTTFLYRNLKLYPETITLNRVLKIQVDVTNTGKLTGDEVVQLYIRDKAASVTRPAKELKGFKRITLEPDETRTVIFQITTDMLAYTGLDLMPVIEPGEFEVMVGTNSNEYQSKIFTLI